MYNTYFPRANAGLGVNAIHPAWFEQGRLLPVRAGQPRPGQRVRVPVPASCPDVYDWNYMEQEQASTVPSRRWPARSSTATTTASGRCDKTYLAAAAATGGDHLAAARGHRGRPGLRRRLHGTMNQIDTPARGRHQERSAPTRCSSPPAASAPASCWSRCAPGQLPQPADAVGQGWGNNGNVMVGRANHIWNPTGALQSGMPAVGIDNWADPAGAVFAEIAPLPDRHRDCGSASTWPSPRTRTARRSPATAAHRSGRPELADRHRTSPPSTRPRRVFDTINATAGHRLPHRPVRRRTRSGGTTSPTTRSAAACSTRPPTTTAGCPATRACT